MNMPMALISVDMGTPRFGWQGHPPWAEEFRDTPA